MRVVAPIKHGASLSSQNKDGLLPEQYAVAARRSQGLIHADLGRVRRYNLLRTRWRTEYGKTTQCHIRFVERFEHFDKFFSMKGKAFQHRNVFVRCGSLHILLHYILNAQVEVVGTWIQAAHRPYPNLEHQRSAACYRDGNRPGVASVRRI